MNEIIHASALDITPEMLATFDVQITDFPYSPHVHENAASVGVVGGDGMGVHDRDLGFEPLSPELRMQGAIAAACVKRWSIMFTDHEGAQAWRNDVDACGGEYIRTVPWIRWSQPQLSGDRPGSGSEVVLAFHRQHVGPRGGRKPIAKHWNGPGSLTHFDRRCMRGKEKHPTEKPIDLMLDLVCYFSDPGERVVDLAAGRATTALACRLLDRQCFAVELDASEVRLGGQRLSGALSARDHARAVEWCVTVQTEAERVPAPRAPDGSDVMTWERAQRRIADVARVMAKL